MAIKIANGAGFLGDNLDAPRLLVENATVDYLTLEYLAELTMSILARQRQKDPSAGYARDFIEVLGSLTPAITAQPQLKVVTNSGGVNPVACAIAAGKLLVGRGLAEVQIGVVTGDDLLGRIPELQSAGCGFVNLDTGQPLADLRSPIVSANAYLGAVPIVEALERKARVVITGRVADASLTVGPAMHEFQRQWDDWNFLAGASVAGHLIECGAQVTGGLYRHWQNLNLADVGYPIAEISEDGSCTITKPDGSAGVVNRHTVAEQLVYEIGDPAQYITPDVIVDFTSVEVEQIGSDRVRVRGAIGQVPTDTYKVSLAYDAGFTATGQLLVYGSDCVEKACACGEMILERVQRAGFKLERTSIECLGAGQAVPRKGSGFSVQASEVTQLASGQWPGDGQRTGIRSQQIPPSAFRLPPSLEVVLRVTVHDSRRDAVERFTKEFAPLITSGPPGIAGYAAGRPQVRNAFGYWPTLVPKQLVQARVTVRSADEWAKHPAESD